MRVLTFRITLLEPGLVTALDGDPNSAVAYDYLPGSVLRGAVIRNYLRNNGHIPLGRLLDTPDAQRLFFDGTTRYLNGYLLDGAGQRSLPTLLSWQQDKKAAALQTPDHPAPVFDFAIAPRDGQKQWQAVNKPFWTLADGLVRFARPERLLAIHTARNRRFGRPQDPSVVKDEDPGAIYRYEALAAGQVFQAAIICDYAADANMLADLLSGQVSLGGSRSGGYGRATLELVDHGSNEGPTQWREVGGSLALPSTGRLVITLLSDALLRSDHGQFVADPRVAVTTLCKRLGVSLHDAFVRWRPVGGFNRKWGLPLPQALAARMGSVFVFDASAGDEQVLLKELGKLECKGMGERRAEGFGRVAVNWHTAAEWAVEILGRAKPPGPVTITDTTSLFLAQRMTERMLRQRMDARVTALANRIKPKEPPHPAQLARLRNIIHDELMQPAPNPKRVSDFLDQIRKRNAARKQFEKARVGSMRLVDWLDQTLNQSDNLEKLLNVQPNKLAVGSVTPALNSALRAEYVLRYVDAVLACAAKVKRGEG